MSNPGAARVRELALERYYANPTICGYCDKVLEIPDGVQPGVIRRKKYCNHSCAAKSGNRQRGKVNRQPYRCQYCGKELTGKNRRHRKYCSHSCEIAQRRSDYITAWLNGDIDGVRGKDGLSSHVRNYLLEKMNYCCERCGWGKINPHTNRVPLTIHHKDGNYRNNTPDNLQVLCPNCHSLTKTYGGANKGNGRSGRREQRKRA